MALGSFNTLFLYQYLKIDHKQEKHDQDPTITVSDHYILNTCRQRLRGSLSDYLWRRWGVRHLLPWFDEN